MSTATMPPMSKLTSQSLAEAMPHVSARFAQEGAVAIVLIDTSPLEEIERFYGVHAYEQVHNELTAAVRQLAEHRLDPEDVVTRGDGATDELVIFMFRDRDDHRFYRHELPALAEEFSDHLRRNAYRIVRPYKKDAVFLPVGHWFALHNSTMREERLVRRSISHARHEARLNSMVDSRRLRRQFLDLLLTEDIRCVYEPIVNLSSQDVYGYEALVRGKEGSELQSPAALFRTAEDAGLMFEFDCLCRKTALKRAGARLRPVEKLFLNCLPSSIHDPNFYGEKLQETLDRAQLRPSDIVFEISEKESISNFDLLRRTRDHFGNLGFQIALDDTGVGYSSLESVIKLVPDYIKVDMSLIQGIDQDSPRQELVRALLSVAEKMGATMIAEGIETSEELVTLLAIGVPFGQGYLFSRPSSKLRQSKPATGTQSKIRTGTHAMGAASGPSASTATGSHGTGVTESGTGAPTESDMETEIETEVEKATKVESADVGESEPFSVP